MKIQVWLLTGMLAVTPVTWAGNCPNLMAEIDEFLASKPDLDEETIVDEDLNKSVKQLREEGEKLHNDGKHDESIEVLEKAIELLKEETG